MLSFLIGLLSKEDGMTNDNIITLHSNSNCSNIPLITMFIDKFNNIKLLYNKDISTHIIEDALWKAFDILLPQPSEIEKHMFNKLAK